MTGRMGMQDSWNKDRLSFSGTSIPISYSDRQHDRVIELLLIKFLHPCVNQFGAGRPADDELLLPLSLSLHALGAERLRAVLSENQAVPSTTKLFIQKGFHFDVL